jgi:hypothetical protein
MSQIPNNATSLAFLLHGRVFPVPPKTELDLVKIFGQFLLSERWRIRLRYSWKPNLRMASPGLSKKRKR